MSLKKSKCLTLYEKSLVVEELKAGQRVTYLSKKYGVAKSTICKIKEKQELISSAVRNTYLGPGKRQTLKSSEFPIMEKRLYTWFLDQRNKNVNVSGEMIKEKAKLLNSQINENDREFSASEGWLQRFKKRFGIRFFKVPKMKRSSKPEPMVPLKIRIEELGITLEQLYNADATMLYWKLLPDKIFVRNVEESTPGRKTEKQRISYLPCTNAIGSHKVKPVATGKAARLSSCPDDSRDSESASLTAAIFKDWFHYSFVPQVSFAILLPKG